MAKSSLGVLTTKYTKLSFMETQNNKRVLGENQRNLHSYSSEQGFQVFHLVFWWFFVCFVLFINNYPDRYKVILWI